jgi:hypothetical protein
LNPKYVMGIEPKYQNIQFNTVDGYSSAGVYDGGLGSNAGSSKDEQSTLSPIDVVRSAPAKRIRNRTTSTERGTVVESYCIYLLFLQL